MILAEKGGIIWKSQVRINIVVGKEGGGFQCFEWVSKCYEQSNILWRRCSFMKKLIATLTTCALCVSAFSVTAFAQESTDSWEVVECGDTQMASYRSIPELPNAEPNWEDSSVISRASSIQVNVQSPLETSWRNSYSDYYYQANRVVERIDDYLASKFGIDFYSTSQPHWSTKTTSSSSSVLSDATNNVGKGSADLMIAFAGSLVDTSTSATFGVAYVGQPYALVFDHSYTQNCKSAQHEVGHTYGLQHCTSTCVMKQGWDNSWSLFEHLCSSHNSQWNSAKNKY